MRSDTFTVLGIALLQYYAGQTRVITGGKHTRKAWAAMLPGGQGDGHHPPVAGARHPRRGGASLPLTE